MNKKNAQIIAKMILKKSINNDGIVDAKKVQQILKEITYQKPPQLINILKMYKKLIAANLAREEIIVETAQKLPNQQKFETDILTKTSAKRISYKINPNIVLGAKITHGDWVYDETLNTKLDNLTKTI